MPRNRVVERVAQQQQAVDQEQPQHERQGGAPARVGRRARGRRRGGFQHLQVADRRVLQRLRRVELQLLLRAQLLQPVDLPGVGLLGGLRLLDLRVERGDLPLQRAHDGGEVLAGAVLVPGDERARERVGFVGRPRRAAVAHRQVDEARLPVGVGLDRDLLAEGVDRGLGRLGLPEVRQRVAQDRPARRCGLVGGHVEGRRGHQVDVEGLQAGVGLAGQHRGGGVVGGRHPLGEEVRQDPGAHGHGQREHQPATQQRHEIAEGGFLLVVHILPAGDRVPRSDRERVATVFREVGVPHAWFASTPPAGLRQEYQTGMRHGSSRASGVRHASSRHSPPPTVPAWREGILSAVDHGRPSDLSAEKRDGARSRLRATLRRVAAGAFAFGLVTVPLAGVLAGVLYTLLAPVRRAYRDRNALAWVGLFGGLSLVLAPHRLASVLPWLGWLALGTAFVLVAQRWSAADAGAAGVGFALGAVVTLGVGGTAARLPRAGPPRGLHGASQPRGGSAAGGAGGRGHGLAARRRSRAPSRAGGRLPGGARGAGVDRQPRSRSGPGGGRRRLAGALPVALLLAAGCCLGCWGWRC